MLDALSPQRRQLVIVVGIVVAALVVAVAVVALIRTRPGTEAPQDQPGPVLLVAGYGGRLESLDPVAEALQAAGRTVVRVSPVGNNTDDLDAESIHLGEVAEQARAEAQTPSVDVVGYSAGGVVARLWVREHGGASIVRRVLTLGSPQHGTSVAALGRDVAGGCPVACQQLTTDSDLLRRLNAGDETPAGPLWTTVRSRSDQVVTPVDSAALAGALNLVVQDFCPGSRAAHGDLPGDPVVQATLASVFGVDPPHPPDRVVC